MLGKDHPDVAKQLNNLALLCQNQGKYEEVGPVLCQNQGRWEEVGPATVSEAGQIGGGRSSAVSEPG